jgi:hypothetical protein
MRRPHPFSAPLAAATWLLVLVTAAAASSEPIGRVVEQTGKVFLVRDGEVSALRPGVAVSDADRVVTSSDGKVLIQFHDSSLCAVGPGSEVLLADLAAPTGGLIDLIHGIVRLVLSPGARATETGVRSRAAVASVRSTEFVVDATLDRAAVFVAKGTVQVTGRLTGASVTLGPGEGTDVDLRKPPTPIHPWGEKRIREVMSRTTVP